MATRPFIRATANGFWPIWTPETGTVRHHESTPVGAACPAGTSTPGSPTGTRAAGISWNGGACTGSVTRGPAGATPARTPTRRARTRPPRCCVSSGSIEDISRRCSIRGRTFLQRVFPSGRELAVRASVRSVEPALLALALGVVLAGQRGTAGQGADGASEVLYLGGDHEELARRALRHLGKGLQVEVAQGFRGEVRAFQTLEELTRHLDLGCLDVAVGFGLAFGAEHRGALIAFRRQDRGAAGPLGLHLLLHRLLDVAWRDDLLQLHPRHPDAPLLRHLVEDRAELRVDLVA